MDMVEKQESPIIRVTRWSETLSLPKKGSKVSKKYGDKTVYGIDAEGNEKVYAQVHLSGGRNGRKQTHFGTKLKLQCSIICCPIQRPEIL